VSKVWICLLRLQDEKGVQKRGLWFVIKGLTLFYELSDCMTLCVLSVLCCGQLYFTEGPGT